MYQTPKKPPPANKRHTKPCKYFQARKCPHPADVCDFAHVVPALPVGRKSLIMCRYDAAGHCKNGSSCHYRHRGDGVSVDGVLIADPEPRPEWQSIGSPTDNAYAETSPFGYASYNDPWGSSSVINIPVFPSNSTLHNAIDLSPLHSRNSICTTTSMSSTDSDDVVVITEAPSFTEHSHLYQSQVRVVEAPSPTHIPPLYPTLNNSLGIHTPTWVDPRPQVNVTPRVSSRSSVRPKPLKYKTKPCKFYNRETGCPSGEECTFRHNELVHPNTSKNYFPISWRVIGGGVLIGSKKTDYDPEEGSVSSSESLGSLEPSAPKPTSLPLPKTFSRPRSNSIPPTPTTNQVKVGSLFSAESPGVL